MSSADTMPYLAGGARVRRLDSLVGAAPLIFGRRRRPLVLLLLYPLPAELPSDPTDMLDSEEGGDEDGAGADAG